MNRLLLAALMLCALPCFAMERAQSFCMVGAQKTITQGLQSTNDIMASYPQCQVNVYFAGTTTPAAIFSDDGVTSLTNPFTANTDASWGFYAADGHYDVVLSGGQAGGFPVPFTISNIFLNSGGGGGSQPTVEVNGIVVQPPVYNFINGTNTVITNPENGDIRIDSTGGGAACGSNFIPCLNTPNTWLTGIQTFLSSGVNDIPIVVRGSQGGATNPSYVQGAVSFSGGPFFGCAVTLTGVTPGDALLAIGYSTHDGVNPATVTDNFGDTYTLAAFANTGRFMSVLVAPNVAGGDTTLTFNNLAEVKHCTVIEYSGIAPSNPVDTAIIGAFSQGSFPSPLSIGPITTTNDADLLVAIADNLSNDRSTPPTSYTATFGMAGNFSPISTAGLAVATTGSYSTSWTYTGNILGDYGIAIIALKAFSPLFQTADLTQWQDWTQTVRSSVNSLGQYVMPSYVGGPSNAPSGPALAYNSTSNCPMYYNPATLDWVSMCSSGGGTPGGSNGSIQVNNSGAFGGATSAQIATALDGTPQPLIGSTLKGTGLTPGNCLQASTGGLIIDTGTACGASGGGITALTGDGTASGSGSVAFTLATVNSGPGACGDATHVCQVTTNGKGLVTGQSAVVITGLSSLPFSSITAATSTAALVIGTGGSLGISGTGTITATGLTGSPAITVSSITDSGLTPGNCLQASTGGHIVDTGVACGSGSGSGGITALTGDANASGTGSVPSVVRGINGVILSTLGTGLLKNTAGVPSIAVANTDYLPPNGNGSGLTALNASNFGSGTVPAARLPNPTASTLGGIQSKAAVTNQWINSISTLGVPSSSQPAFSNIAGTIASAQLPQGSSSAIGGLQCGSGTSCSAGVISVTGGGGGISGLTSGFLPKATSGSTIGNSLIDEGISTANTATIGDSGGLNVAGTGASIIGFGGPGVTLTKASAVTSATCVSSCLTARGSFTVVAGTATTGTLVTVSFNAPAPSSAPVCGVSQSGGSSFIGLGHGTPSTSGFTVTAGASAAGQTFTVDYWCAR